MNIYGMIHSVDVSTKIITIKQPKKLMFFYFQTSLMHMFKRYLYQGNIISLEYDENQLIIKGNKETYQVLYVLSLFAPSKYCNKSYYDKHFLNDSLKKFLNEMNNLLFLDLEMTMPNFNDKGHFDAEIIQAGFVLTDKNFNSIIEKNMYIYPSVSKTINGRTKKFLKIDVNKFMEKTVSYQTFYDYFKELILAYKPTIIVYGKNDVLFLDKSYILNNKESLKPHCRFVNLNQLIRNYYDLRNDLGLFKLNQFYTEDETPQIHDALDDSLITKNVYRIFKDDVNNKKYSKIDIRNVFE